MGRGAGGHDCQSEGQASAARDDLVDRRGFGQDSLDSGPVSEQFARLVVREHVQDQPPGAVRGHQAREPAAAGHHDEAGPAAGQQRPDLGGVPGVVEHDQEAPAGQQRAVERGRRLQLDRNPPALDAQPLEQRRERLDRARGRPLRVRSSAFESDFTLSKPPCVDASPTASTRSAPTPRRRASVRASRAPRSAPRASCASARRLRPLADLDLRVRRRLPRQAGSTIPSAGRWSWSTACAALRTPTPPAAGADHDGRGTGGGRPGPGSRAAGRMRLQTVQRS